MKDLIEKIIEYSNVIKEPMFIGKTDSGALCGKSTIDGEGIILFTKGRGIKIVNRKTIFKAEDKIDYKALEELKKNRDTIEKEYNSFIEIKKAKEEKLKQFILIDRKMKELVKKSIVSELFIDKYSKLSTSFKRSLRDKIDWNFIMNDDIKITCSGDKVFVNNDYISLEVKLLVYGMSSEIENLNINIKDMDFSEGDLERLFEKIEKKNAKIFKDFYLDKITALVSSYISLIHTVELFIKETMPYLEKMKEKRIFSSLYLDNKKDIACIKLVDNIDHFTLSMYTEVGSYAIVGSLLEITTDSNFKIIKQEILQIEDEFYDECSIYISDIKLRYEFRNLEATTRFLKSFDNYILDLVREENIIEDAFKKIDEYNEFCF